MVVVEFLHVQEVRKPAACQGGMLIKQDRFLPFVIGWMSPSHENQQLTTKESAGRRRRRRRRKKERFTPDKHRQADSSSYSCRGLDVDLPFIPPKNERPPASGPCLDSNHFSNNFSNNSSSLLPFRLFRRTAGRRVVFQVLGRVSSRWRTVNSHPSLPHS